MGCGCKCDCPEGLCVDNTCWGCNPCPPPTCGCNVGVTSGETCINTTYYYYGNNSGQNIYYKFNFQYVIFIPLDGSSSIDDTIQQFMYSWFYFCNGGGFAGPITSLTDVGFGTSLPSGYTLEDSVSANNSYMWQTDWVSYINANPAPPANGPTDIFTGYTVGGDCDYGYPGDSDQQWCQNPSSN